MRISDFMNYTPPYSLPDTESQHKTERQYFVEEELNMDALYTSGHWKNALLQSAGLYENEEMFISVMLGKLQQIASPLVYEQLAEALISICETHGWNEQVEQLAYFLLNDGRIKSPTGKLQLLMTMYKLSLGAKAPALSQGKLPKGKKTLLVFHESGCGSCVTELEHLIEDYPQLQKKGYEVVSISADTDLVNFQSFAESFPWQAKYCNGEGMAGKDFQNYGVIGTPTMYIIDEKGDIQKRAARLIDLDV